MPLDRDRQYNDAQRREYLNLTDRVGMNWMEVFEGDQDFYSAAYWDLLTGIWRAGEPIRKTEALGLMKGIKSVHTAGKYLETAITRGIVVETDNPQDARSKLVQLSAEMRKRLDGFFDSVVSVFFTGFYRIAAKASETFTGTSWRVRKSLNLLRKQ